MTETIRDEKAKVPKAISPLGEQNLGVPCNKVHVCQSGGACCSGLTTVYAEAFWPSCAVVLCRLPPQSRAYPSHISTGLSL